MARKKSNGARKTIRKPKKSKKRKSKTKRVNKKINLDKLANISLFVESNIEKLNKKQKKSLSKNIKRIQKESIKVRSGQLDDEPHPDHVEKKTTFKKFTEISKNKSRDFINYISGISKTKKYLGLAAVGLVACALAMEDPNEALFEKIAKNDSFEGLIDEDHDMTKEEFEREFPDGFNGEGSVPLNFEFFAGTKDHITLDDIENKNYLHTEGYGLRPGPDPTINVTEFKAAFPDGIRTSDGVLDFDDFKGSDNEISRDEFSDTLGDNMISNDIGRLLNLCIKGDIPEELKDYCVNWNARDISPKDYTIIHNYFLDNPST